MSKLDSRDGVLRLERLLLAAAVIKNRSVGCHSLWCVSCHVYHAFLCVHNVDITVL